MDIPWVIEEQTKVKHELLKCYISPWMHILFNNQARHKIPEVLLYFDGFSGPGIYFADESKTITCPGSPIIVAEKANLYIEDKPARKIFMFCIDKDSECVEYLGKEIAKINKYRQRWEVYQAEFVDKIDEILNEIEAKRLHFNPMFFFMDPFGYTGYPMDTLRRIMAYPRAELFINFMVYDIVRFCETQQHEANLIKQFGTDEFKNIRDNLSPEKRQAFIVNLYCRNLKQIAGAEYVMPFRVNTPGQGIRPRYYLIHASKHSLALKTMKDNMAKISDVLYRFEAIGIDTKQMNLFEDPEKISLIERVHGYCKGLYPRDVDYEELESWAYANTNGISRTIKATLKDLENSSKISIARRPGQRELTVTKGARIKFKSA